MNQLVNLHFKSSRHVVIAFLGLLILGMMATNASASSKISPNPLPGPTQSKFSSVSDPLDRTGTLFAPFIEWSLTNSTFSGNPFDLIATATFTHTNSGEQRTTEMFYDGGDVWRFRFTGTRTGEWTFVTSSANPELGGRSGTVTINPNADPNIKGFMTNVGNKFAIQTGDNGELEAYRYNIFQPNIVGTHLAFVSGSLPSLQQNPQLVDAVVEDLKIYGFDTVPMFIAHGALSLGAATYNDHNSEDPSIESFQEIETIISLLHAKGMRVQFSMWGDEQRQMTPVGLPGGINGFVDQRMQRYLAARLGPLPGWSLGYGFDLEEWVSSSQIGVWGAFLHSKLGWDHMLWARGQFHSEMDAKSYSDTQHSYGDAVGNLDGDASHPQIFEERDIYLRSFKGKSSISMDWTRQALWVYTMAGGHAGYFGNNRNGASYPEPETLRTVSTFWEDRFLFGMKPANGLTDGFAMDVAATDQYVFYKENTSSIQADLSGMASSQPAIAVDTRAEYVEVVLGVLNATNQTISLPYSSDWAVAVGTYGVPADDTPPSTPTGLSATTVGESQIDLDWQPADDPESGIAVYNVYRDGVAIGSTTVTSYSDEGLLESNTYDYRVSAVNGAAIEGDKSNTASAQTAQDVTPPTVTGVSVTALVTEARVTFSEPVAQAGATNPANFSIDNGIDVLSATLSDDLKTVTLVTDAHLDGVNYTLGVQNVTDRAADANEIAPDTQFSYTLAIELVVSGLTVGSNLAYKVVDLGLVSGEKPYTDRGFSFTDIPSHLAGWTFIRTANSDKSQTAENFMTFEVNQPVTIHMAFDVRASSLPNWLADWTDTGFLIGTTDVDRNLYSREFSTGTITLGANSAVGASGADSNYNAIIVPGGGGPPPDDPPPTAPLVTVTDANVAKGATVPIQVLLSSVPTGLSGFDMTVKLSSPGIALLASAVLPNLGVAEITQISASEIRLSFADTEGLVNIGDTDVTLATVNVQGTAKGNSLITVNLMILDDESGNVVNVDIEDGMVNVSNVAPTITASSDVTAIAGDITSIPFSIVDPDDGQWTVTINYGDGSVTQALQINSANNVLNYKYAEPGDYQLTLMVADADSDTGTKTISVTVVNPAFPTLPGMNESARDLDGDGKAEDLNGNGRLDFADIVALFVHIDSLEVTNNPDAFDFNGNGTVDMADIVALFEQLVQ